jgi:hypothetical protein
MGYLVVLLKMGKKKSYFPPQRDIIIAFYAGVVVFYKHNELKGYHAVETRQISSFVSVICRELLFA